MLCVIAVLHGRMKRQQSSKHGRNLQSGLRHAPLLDVCVLEARQELIVRPV